MLKVSKKFKSLALAGLLSLCIIPVNGCSSKNSNEGYEPTEYAEGEHQIVSVEKRFDPFLGKNGTYGLEAPEWYKITDYDYDKTDSFEFVNITYVNNQQVKVNDINQFGEVVDKVESKKQGNTYDVGTDFMVVLNRNFNPFFGKDEMKEVPNIPGYVVVDYDYDKTD